jgi:hypothetical protein
MAHRLINGIIRGTDALAAGTVKTFGTLQHALAAFSRSDCTSYSTHNFKSSCFAVESFTQPYRP